jgi:hypothetical protein
MVADRSFAFLETVFWVSATVLRSVPVVAVGGEPLGRVWEGATAPLPIERGVSEANSELGGLGGRKTAAERKLSTGDFSRARIREGLKMIKQKINRRNYLILN